ncbi:hypothetical protein SCUP515_04858 [Seiridium cupressi]
MASEQHASVILNQWRIPSLKTLGSDGLCHKILIKIKKRTKYFSGADVSKALEEILYREKICALNSLYEEGHAPSISADYFDWLIAMRLWKGRYQSPDVWDKINSEDYFNYWVTRRGLEGDNRIESMTPVRKDKFHRRATMWNEATNLCSQPELSNRAHNEIVALTEAVMYQRGKVSSLEKEVVPLRKKITRTQSLLNIAYEAKSTCVSSHEIMSDENRRPRVDKEDLQLEKNTTESRVRELEAETHKMRECYRKEMEDSKLESEKTCQALRHKLQESEALTTARDKEIALWKNKYHTLRQNVKSLKRNVDEMEKTAEDS